VTSFTCGARDALGIRARAARDVSHTARAQRACKVRVDAHARCRIASHEARAALSDGARDARVRTLHRCKAATTSAAQCQ
jgi:hypothetical protein